MRELWQRLDIGVDEVAWFVVLWLLGAIFQAAETGLFAVADVRIAEMVKEAEARKSRLQSLLRIWHERPEHILTAIVVGKHAAHVALVVSMMVTLAADTGRVSTSTTRARKVIGSAMRSARSVRSSSLGGEAPAAEPALFG